MKKLGGIDASFLYMETPETPMHGAGLTLIELPAGYSGSFYGDYKAHIARRLHLAPLLAKKLVPVPFDIDHPLLVDDDEMNLDYHIRHLVLSPPDPAMLLGTAYTDFLSQQIKMIQAIPDVWKTIANFTTRHAELRT